MKPTFSYQDKLHIRAEKLIENPHVVTQEFIQRKSKPLRIGGMDLAKRVDHSAFIILKLEDGILKQEAHYIWPHVKYGKVAGDILKFQDKMPMEKIGFDRNSVGDFAIELFDKTALPMEGIVTTMKSKLDMINVLKILFHQGLLKIDKKSELVTQISEQEQIITEAGNTTYKHIPGRHDDLFWALCYACYVSLEYIVNMVEPIIRYTPTDNPEKTVDDVISSVMGSGASSFSI